MRCARPLACGARSRRHLPLGRLRFACAQPAEGFEQAPRGLVDHARDHVSGWACNHLSAAGSRLRLRGAVVTRERVAVGGLSLPFLVKLRRALDLILIALDLDELAINVDAAH
jgi:hypothetical protein